jgi:spore photoproduct lyase
MSGIMLNSNIESFLESAQPYLAGLKRKTVRIGTGEFTDSLALDGITGYSKELVNFFRDKNVLFELKTKSANVSNLAGLNHNNRTVVSWSLNPEKIIGTEELGSASLSGRLKAAAACYNEGYKIGFHFDPVIFYEGWEEDYKNTVDRLFDAVNQVEWISIGSFRFSRELKGVIEQRFPEADYIYGELIIGQDKKMRYYEKLRLEIYKKMVKWIRQRNKKTALYLCMEPVNVWKEVFKDYRPYWMLGG